MPNEHAASARPRFEASSVRRLLVPALGALLLVRVLRDHASASDSRFSGSLNVSGVIAVVFIAGAVGLLLARRRWLLPAVLAGVWLAVWTAVAVSSRGASTETLREGVREASVVALVVIVYNARGAFSVPVATRLIQVLAVYPAILALYQLATNSGMDVAGHIRSNGTFAHPNSAVMFFSLAATASLWRYLDRGRRVTDALLVVLFAGAVLSTYSLDGLVSLIAMMAAFGFLHHGSLRTKLVPYVVAGLTVLVFFATPLGSERVAKESSTSLAGEPNTSLSWRFQKWEKLMPKWEASPVFGQGLGTTTTELSTPSDRYASLPPHSEYVRYLVETGVVGVVTLLLVLAILMRSLVRSRKRLGTADAGDLGASSLAIAIVVGCLVNALADNTLLNSPTSYAAALIVAAVLASHGMERRQARALQTA